MPQSTGKTYGFGRVSPETRPSPYTPVHLPSVAPGVSRAAGSAPDALRTRRHRRVAGVLTVVVVATVSALAAAGFLRAASRTTADHRDDGATSATRIALDEEAERLARSAFAALHKSSQR